MEVNNTFTSLIADLPYPSKQSQSSDAVKNEQKESQKSFDTVLRDEHNQEKQTTPSANENSTSVNILV